jgi:hypothetical protein
MTFIKKIAVAGIAAAVLAGSLLPAEAMPRVAAPAAGIEASSDVVTVQYRRRHGGDWYNGHRGYRDRRPGYRHYNGYWFPLAAFGAGALIGGALAAPDYEPAPRYVEPAPRYVAPAPRYVERSDINPRHYEWCYDRYRSYDSYSNTFQPNYGPRQTCLSPYY